MVVSQIVQSHIMDALLAKQNMSRIVFFLCAPPRPPPRSIGDPSQTYSNRGNFALHCNSQQYKQFSKRGTIHTEGLASYIASCTANTYSARLQHGETFTSFKTKHALTPIPPPPPHLRAFLTPPKVPTSPHLIIEVVRDPREKNTEGKRLSGVAILQRKLPRRPPLAPPRQHGRRRKHQERCNRYEPVQVCRRYGGVASDGRPGHESLGKVGSAGEEQVGGHGRQKTDPAEV